MTRKYNGDYRMDYYSELTLHVPGPLDSEPFDPRPPNAPAIMAVMQNPEIIIPCRVQPGHNEHGIQPADILPTDENAIVAIGLKGLGASHNNGRITYVENSLPPREPGVRLVQTDPDTTSIKFTPRPLRREVRTYLGVKNAVAEVVHFTEKSGFIVPTTIGRLAVVCGNYFGAGSLLFADIFISEES